jgi:hypothetical protein
MTGGCTGRAASSVSAVPMAVASDRRSVVFSRGWRASLAAVHRVVETITYPSRRLHRRRRAARHLTEENQNDRPFKAGRDLRTVSAGNKRATSDSAPARTSDHPRS